MNSTTSRRALPVFRSALVLAAWLGSAGLTLATEPGSKPGAAEVPQWRWMGPEGQPLPFREEADLLEFLEQAKVVSKDVITTGVNRPWKLLLERDGVRAHAMFRNVDEKQDRVKIQGRYFRNFHDSYIYEVAAYRLSRLLGMDSVPPCVERRLQGQTGSLQLWVEGSMIENDRRKAGRQPPRALNWQRQRQNMHVFDALIDNFDRNLGNQLVDSSWKLWLIDHTRSFTWAQNIDKSHASEIIWCERGLWEKLQGLERKALAQHLRPPLTYVHIDALLKRRDKLVKLIEKKIAQNGELAVIFDWPPGAEPGG